MSLSVVTPSDPDIWTDTDYQSDCEGTPDPVARSEQECRDLWAEALDRLEVAAKTDAQRRLVPALRTMSRKDAVSFVAKSTFFEIKERGALDEEDEMSMNALFVFVGESLYAKIGDTPGIAGGVFMDEVNVDIRRLLDANP